MLPNEVYFFIIVLIEVHSLLPAILPGKICYQLHIIMSSYELFNLLTSQPNLKYIYIYIYIYIIK